MVFTRCARFDLPMQRRQVREICAMLCLPLSARMTCPTPSTTTWSRLQCPPQPLRQQAVGCWLTTPCYDGYSQRVGFCAFPGRSSPLRKCPVPSLPWLCEHSFSVGSRSTFGFVLPIAFLTSFLPIALSLLRIYVHRLKAAHPHLKGRDGSEFRLAISSLMLANKVSVASKVCDALCRWAYRSCSPDSR